MTNAQAIRTIRKAIKNQGIDCKVGRVGTGKNFVIALWGSDARVVALVMAGHGLSATPMSGPGTRINPITITA